MVDVKEKIKGRACAPRKGERARGKPSSASSHLPQLPRPFRPSFFKIMLDTFEEVLFIPPKLTNVLVGLVNQNVHLKDFNGDIWRVKVSMINNSLAFKEGWKIFVSDHSISIGEFLLFKHVSKALFSVKIYGTSACERVDFDKRNDNTFSDVSISKAELSERSQFAKRRKVSIASDAKKDSEEKHDPSSFSKRPMEDACERIDFGKINDGTFPKNRDEADLSPERSLPVTRHTLVVASNGKEVAEEKYNPNFAEVLVQDFCERVGMNKRKDLNSSKTKRKKTNLSPERSEFSRQHKLAVASDSKEDSKGKHVPVKDASERVGLGKGNDNNSSKENRKKNNLCPKKSQFSLQCKQNASTNPKKDLKEKHGAAKNTCARVGFGKRNRAACAKFETFDQVTCSQETISNMVNHNFLLAEDGICHIVSEDSMNGLGAVRVTPACLSDCEICTKIRGNDYAVSMSRDVTSNHESIPNVNCVAPVLISDLEPEQNSSKSGITQNLKITGTLSDVLPDDDKKEDDASFLRSQDHKSVKVEPMDFGNLYSSNSCSFSLTSASNNQDWIECPQPLLLRNCKKKTPNKAVLLRDPLLRVWPVLYYETVNFAALTSGWYDFAKANNLRQGSKCEFLQIADDFNPTFLVLITHPSR